MTWWSGLPIVMNQSSYTRWNDRSSRSYHARQVVLLSVQTYDSTKVFLSDDQGNSDAAFPQGRVGLEKVVPKSTRFTLSHGFASSAISSQQYGGNTKTNHKNVLCGRPQVVVPWSLWSHSLVINTTPNPISFCFIYLFKHINIGTKRHQIDMSHINYSIHVRAGTLPRCPN
ncbi:unnamed protein product [Schistosoma margrebowiei]|uniref:Uncharacterized protein n=1 Tax=Schistosoma margrebowiei TaxID=48269 RepID=A0A3P7WFJ4_9TREM|nr:unnamed protein product [Schistosoma margrebowiei]